MRRPRLNVLRTFEVAGRHLSFAQAAAELNISPPAVSQQIRQLEAHLGSPLFVRQGRQLLLTSAGQAYHETVHQVIERLDTVTDQLFPTTNLRPVTIRCTPSVASLWIVPRLGTFHKQHPEIDLSIKTLDTNHKDTAHPSDDLEIVILNDPGASAIPNTHGQHDVTLLLTATVVPVCAPTLLNGPLSTPEELMQFTPIHVLGYDEDWHAWARHNDSDKINIPRGIKVDGSLIAIEMAQRGEGIMLGRRPFIDSLLESGDLIEMFEGDVHMTSRYYLRNRRVKGRNHARETVANWVQNLS